MEKYRRLYVKNVHLGIIELILVLLKYFSYNYSDSLLMILQFNQYMID